MDGRARAFVLALATLGPPAWAAAAAASPAARVRVEEIARTDDDRYLVVLRTAAGPPRFLPMWMEPGEALPIQLRLERREGPMLATLGLVQSLFQAGHIRVTQAALVGGPAGEIVGRVSLQQQHRTWEVAARPGDAIALALRAHAPILVSPALLVAASAAPPAEAGAASPRRPPVDLADTL